MDLRGKGHAKFFVRLGKTGRDTIYMMKSTLKDDFLDNHIVSDG
jgi:hypothetical protein